LLIISNGMAQYTVGQTVADFTLNDVYGNSHTLYNYQGNIVLLNFFATW
jgi:peroxiredoxin